MFVDRWLLLAVYCSSFVVCCSLFAVACRLLLLGGGCAMSVVRCLLCVVIRGLLFVVCVVFCYL